MIDALASHPRFARHLLPVWEALPPEHRGTLVMVPREGRLLDYAALLPEGRPVLVADADTDGRAVLAAGRGPLVMLEHGTGGVYDGRWLDGHDVRGQVALYLAPGPHAAGHARRLWSCIPVVEVGCPAMDAWHRAPAAPRRGGPTVALSFRFTPAVPLVPELRPATPHFAAAVPGLARRWRVLGHGHPRALVRHGQGSLRALYRLAGVEVVEDFDRVLEEADVFAADNTSTLYEFASTGRPVVVLNAPWYRREVEHGGRFWSAAGVGVQCDGPEALPAAIEEALIDQPERQRARVAALAEVYFACDGAAAARAAAAAIIAALS